jgi:hypothetical protein
LKASAPQNVGSGVTLESSKPRKCERIGNSGGKIRSDVRSDKTRTLENSQTLENAESP